MSVKPAAARPSRYSVKESAPALTERGIDLNEEVPAGQDPAATRTSRDDIEHRVRELLATIGQCPGAGH